MVKNLPDQRHAFVSVCILLHWRRSPGLLVGRNVEVESASGGLVQLLLPQQLQSCIIL